MIFNIKFDQGSVKISHTTLISVGVLSFLFLLVSGASTEYQSSSVVMNATVANVVSINTSTALTRGVLFGSLTVNTNDNMAENDTTNANAGMTNTTEYFVGNGPTSTGNVDLYHYAPNMDREGNADYLNIGNVTHESNKTEGGYNVNMTVTTDGVIVMTTSWVAVGDSNCTAVTVDNVCWIAYWLDVPANIPDGTYNTTYHYCGNLTFGNTVCS